MADLGEVTIRGVASVRWPEGHPRANENPPEDPEPEVQAEDKETEDQKENEE